MPTSETPSFEGSDFYIYVPVKHTSGAEFQVTVGGTALSEGATESAIQDLIDYLNAWPNRDPGSEPVAARKNFIQQYLITSPGVGEEMPDSPE